MKRRTFLNSSIATTSLLSISEVYANKPNPKPFTVKAGESRTGANTPFRGINANVSKVSAKDTDGALSVFEYIGNEKVGPPLHIHFLQDEIFYITEGQYLFEVGGERQTLRTGDSIFLPRNIPHTWLQLTDKGKLLYLLQPAGKMEELFIKLNEMKGPPSEELIQKIHLECNLKVLGPPITI